MVFIDGNVLRGFIFRIRNSLIGIKDTSGNRLYFPMYREYILNLDSINFSNLIEPQEFLLGEKALSCILIRDGDEMVGLVERKVKDSKIFDDISKSYEKARNTFNEYITDTIQISKYENDIDKVIRRCGGFGHVYAVGIKLNYRIFKKIVEWIELHPKKGKFSKKDGKVPNRIEFFFKLDYKTKIMTLPFCIKAKAVSTQAFFEDLSERDETYRIPLKSIHMVKKKLN